MKNSSYNTSYTTQVLRGLIRQKEQDVDSAKQQELQSHKIWQDSLGRFAKEQGELRSLRQSLELLEEVL